MNRKLFLLFFLLLVCRQTFAQESFKDDLNSPFTTSAKYVGLFGTIATGMILVFEDQVVDPTQVEVVEDKALGRYSHYGDLAGQGYPNLLYSAGMLLSYKLTDNPLLYNNAILMVKATAYASLVSTVLKTVVREPRPNDSDTKTSFPSGHATMAFAFASTVASLHEWYWGLAAYTMATTVAYSRMNDNKHFLHDVTAGATIGSVYGIGITELFLKKQESNESPNTFMLIPVQGGVSGVWGWNY
ncbi:hypothetical protein CIK05_04495 [Bdellovibrio sp. qaytius]|nr:hypothetical protein CIK05_04495 [Bdellovibrio sp. qaytius]